MKISASASFDLTSNDAADAGCLSGILRRILCGGLRNHASKISGIGAGIDREPKPPAPGLVARLMGLESMPVFPYAAPETVRRSRSANSIDNWAGLLSYPKIKTSLSFREVPTFLRKENEEFLILSFVSDDGGEDFKSNGEKPSLDFRELKEGEEVERTNGGRTGRRLEEKKTRKRNERRNGGKEHDLGRLDCGIKGSISLSEKDLYRRKPHRHGLKAETSSKPTKQRDLRERHNSTRKRPIYALRKVEFECSSQNSSPVSVLDHHLDIENDSLTGPDSPISEEDYMPKEQNSRRKPPLDLESLRFPSPRIQIDTSSQKGGLSSIDEERNRSRNSEREGQSFSYIWGRICSLAEGDLKISNWVSREFQKSEEIGEIAVVLGMKILDFLLQEAVAEFSSCSSITL